ncbi:hypothetical protein J6836_17020 [Providencia sp. R33]|uniref:hypothetical protein n=1 Tax=Providencia sp. R33 TaxID=2828763 RepID=UPI001C5BAC72|nr:hypothetical protein J6836_17020 [Providencia sp. R33]
MTIINKKNIFSAIILMIILTSFINPYIPILLILASFFIYFKNDYYLIGFITIISSFNGILQIVEKNPIGTSIDTLISLVLILKLAQIIILRKKFQINRNILVAFTIMFLTIILSTIKTAFNYDLIYFALALKDFILPLSCFYYLYLITPTLSKIEKESILRLFVLSITIVAGISLLNYIFNITDSFDRYVIASRFEGNEENAYTRTISGIEIIRMNSLFALSTQAAPSVYYVMALILIYKYNWNTKKRILNILYSIILVLAIFLSVSFSSIFTLFLFYIFYFLFKNIKSPKIILFPIISMILISLLSMVEIESFGSNYNIVEYGYSNFILKSLSGFEHINIIEILIGFGVMPKLYLNEYLSVSDYTLYFRLVYDNWILGGFYQMGILGLALFFFILIAPISYNLTSENNIIIVALLFSMLGFSHGLFILDRLFIIKFCIIYSLIANNNIIFKGKV